ncbi:hypothetical protein [Devosia sp. DBB001]|nr:hypothetical protein [Devosia sp. DBB001]
MNELEELRDKMEAKMADGEPFTFSDLHKGFPDYEAYRLADRLIQQWRKRGWISFVRVGRSTIWSLTDAGRDAIRSHS